MTVFCSSNEILSLEKFLVIFQFFKFFYISCTNDEAYFLFFSLYNAHSLYFHPASIPISTFEILGDSSKKKYIMSYEHYKLKSFFSFLPSVNLKFIVF